MKRKWEIFGIVACLCLAVAVECRGEEGARVFQDWALRPTEAASGWVLEQRVYVTGHEEAPLVGMTIQELDVAVDGETRPALWGTLRIPLGVMLDGGVELRVDEGKRWSISLHHCRQTGCIALWPLSADLRAELEGGREARVTFQSVDGQRIGVPISLMGIKAGLKALDAALADEADGAG